MQLLQRVPEEFCAGGRGTVSSPAAGGESTGDARVHSAAQPLATSSSTVRANATAWSGRSWGALFLRFLRGREGVKGASYSNVDMPGAIG